MVKTTINHLLKKPKNFTDLDYISFLQRWILVMSWIYYEHDFNIVADKQYDSVAYHLADLQKGKHKGIVKDSEYGYVFYDFDGTTGFDLFHKLTEKDKKKLIHFACSVEESYRREIRKEKGRR